MTRTKWCILLLCCGALLSCATPPEGFEAALAAAKADIATPEGLDYDRTLGERWWGPFDAALNSCYRDLPRANRREVDFLYRIDESGSTVDSMVHPLTNLSECVRDRFREFPQLPPPPHPNYWVLMALGGVQRENPSYVLYPEHLQAQGIEGYAVVEYTMTENGTTKNAFVVESFPDEAFGESALATVSGWRFEIDSSAGVMTERQRKAYFPFCLPDDQATERPRFRGCRNPKNRSSFAREVRRRLNF